MRLGIELGKNHPEIYEEYVKNGEKKISFFAEQLKEKHRDYFIFGHRHLPLEIDLGNNSKYINLGDWISYYTYGVFDGDTFELKKY